MSLECNINVTFFSPLNLLLFEKVKSPVGLKIASISVGRKDLISGIVFQHHLKKKKKHHPHFFGKWPDVTASSISLNFRLLELEKKLARKSVKKKWICLPLSGQVSSFFFLPGNSTSKCHWRMFFFFGGIRIFLLPLLGIPTNIANVNLVVGCSKVFFFTIVTPASAY